MHKITGCCTICDKEIYEILKRFPNGEPRAVGKAIDVNKKQYVLTDGTRFDLSFCSDCNPTAKDYPEMWRKCLNSFVREQGKEFSDMIGNKHNTDGRYYDWMKELSEQSILGQLNG